MKENKEFIEIYTDKKEKKEIRSLILRLIFIANFANFCMVGFYNIAIGNNISLMHNEQSFWIMASRFFTIMIPYNLISLILYIFAEKLEFLIDLYTGVTCFGSSILYFCFSMIIFVKKLNVMEAYLIITISILTYIFLIIAIIKNVRKKIKKGFKTVKVNKQLISAFISLCAALGVIIAKRTRTDGLTPAIVLLILSYLFTPTIIKFNKFYLKFKKERN
ncbi:hypothetical protein [Clostridium sp. SHJSY1]|uniref:hypothetical protein n=1 Tax=Clostridium sp. SHJSY1 TaxID=2942483 RepID=UPI00287B5E9A|nr:hypothetical protein [Clostridium sp. SHJSY1]